VVVYCVTKTNMGILSYQLTFNLIQ